MHHRAGNVRRYALLPPPTATPMAHDGNDWRVARVSMFVNTQLQQQQQPQSQQEEQQ